MIQGGPSGPSCSKYCNIAPPEALRGSQCLQSLPFHSILIVRGHVRQAMTFSPDVMITHSQAEEKISQRTCEQHLMMSLRRRHSSRSCCLLLFSSSSAALNLCLLYSMLAWSALFSVFYASSPTHSSSHCKHTRACNRIGSLKTTVVTAIDPTGDASEFYKRYLQA